MSIALMTGVWSRADDLRGSKLLVMLAIADYANDEGHAYPGIGRIAHKCRISDRSVQRILVELESDGYLSRDIQRGIDTSTGRTNLYRINLDRIQRGDATVTPGVTPMTPRGVTPVSPKPSVKPPVEDTPPIDPPRKTGSRLPDDWTLPDDWRAWAEQERPELDVQAEADIFRDYWVARSGQGATKLDWLATWRNWIRRAKVVRHGDGNNGTRKLSAAERAIEAERRFWDRERRIAQQGQNNPPVEPDGSDLRPPLDGEFWRGDRDQWEPDRNIYGVDAGRGRPDGRGDQGGHRGDDLSGRRLASDAAGIPHSMQSTEDGRHQDGMWNGVSAQQGASTSETEQGQGRRAHPVDARLAAIWNAAGQRWN